MRILFTSVGAYGHLIPLLPLALAAKDAGHEVAVATDPGHHHVLDRAGLDAVSAGISVGEALGIAARASSDPQADLNFPAFSRIMPERMAADLAPVLAENKPDLVVYEMFNAGAGIAAGLAGTPAVCHGFGRLLSGQPWSSLYDVWLAVAAEHGLAQPAANQFLGNPYLDIYPPSLQSPEFPDSVERVLMRPSGWQQNVELPPFVRNRTSGRPLVYVTFGTAFGTAEDLRQVIDGVSALAVDVLVSANRPEIADYLDDLPAHVAVEQWVPQWNLLPHVDLVVSHGGSGTTLDAFARGLPHLVIPQGADQFDNAQAVLDAGAGARILPDQLTAEATTELAGALLDDQNVRDRAGKVAQEIAGMPSPEEALQRLAAFVQ